MWFNLVFVFQKGDSPIKGYVVVQSARVLLYFRGLLRKLPHQVVILFDVFKGCITSGSCPLDGLAQIAKGVFE